MAASRNAASAQIEDFRSDLEEVLSQSSEEVDFARGDKASAARALGRLYRNANHFQEVMLIDDQMGLVYAFPAEETGLTLTGLEQEAVTRALHDRLRTPVVIEIPEKGRMLSLVVPVASFLCRGSRGRRIGGFDRTLMAALREKKDLALSSSRQMSQLLARPEEALPVKALFAIPLQSQNKFQGVYFLGYRQPREFDSSERDLLHTLTGQATVLVDNAYLFSRAEGGRQRLSAVLSSTTEAVLVTDQTERILILNKAMERAFNLSSDRVIGRAVGHVVQSPQLVRALTQPDTGGRDLVIEGKDGRTYFANVSTIVGRKGQVMGRVAVLHDVTHLKEVDRMKSEFVSNVSHDLKTVNRNSRQITTSGQLF